MSIFKVGDKVRVRKDLLEQKKYKSESESESSMGYLTAMNGMVEKRGLETEIIAINSCEYYIEGSCFIYSYEMLEKINKFTKDDLAQIFFKNFKVIVKSKEEWVKLLNWVQYNTNLKSAFDRKEPAIEEHFKLFDKFNTNNYLGLTFESSFYGNSILTYSINRFNGAYYTIDFEKFMCKVNNHKEALDLKFEKSEEQNETANETRKEKVENILGIKDEFVVVEEGDLSEYAEFNPYLINDDGSIVDCDGDCANEILLGIIVGKVKIEEVEKPFADRIKKEMFYYFINLLGNIKEITYLDNSFDKACIKKGNFFETKEEAEKYELKLFKK